MNQLLNNMNATSDHVFMQSMHHSTLDYSDESAVTEGHRSGVRIASVTTTSTDDPVLKSLMKQCTHQRATQSERDQDSFT